MDPSHVASPAPPVSRRARRGIWLVFALGTAAGTVALCAALEAAGVPLSRPPVFGPVGFVVLTGLARVLDRAPWRVALAHGVLGALLLAVAGWWLDR